MARGDIVEAVAQLVLEGLCYCGFGPIDLALAAGECVAVSGPSGSGKTLLLRAVADLDLHAGRVLLDGVECAECSGPAWRRAVGLLRAESRWWRPTAGEHLAGADPHWLSRLGIGAGLLERPVEQLSSGERQRLALLRLLANRPQALLLDEPTAHLDAQAAEAVEALLRDVRRESGAAVLWVTHQAAQAERVAERRFELRDGRLAAAGRA